MIVHVCRFGLRIVWAARRLAIAYCYSYWLSPYGFIGINSRVAIARARSAGAKGSAGRAAITLVMHAQREKQKL